MISDVTPLSMGDRLQIFERRYTMATLDLSEEEVLIKRMEGHRIKEDWFKQWKFNKNSIIYKK